MAEGTDFDPSTSTLADAKPSLNAASGFDMDLFLLDHYDNPVVVWLQEGQVAFESGATYVESGLKVIHESREPAPASGYYLMPYCDPGCCAPEGPFSTVEAAEAHSRKEAEMIRQRRADSKPSF